MTVFLAALALGLVPSAMTGPAPAPQAAQDREVEMVARSWLERVDAGDARGSYAQTAEHFRRVNTQETWARVSASVRGPLGTTLSRTLTTVDFTPTPQHYAIVKFATRFSERQTAMLETVSLIEEGGAWRIAGIAVE